MNKIFKVVFNAARMKYMVVNEMTSSIGPSKKSVMSMAVAAALTCTSAIAATITDVDGKSVTYAYNSNGILNTATTSAS